MRQPRVIFKNPRKFDPANLHKLRNRKKIVQEKISYFTVLNVIFQFTEVIVL